MVAGTMIKAAMKHKFRRISTRSSRSSRMASSRAAAALLAVVLAPGCAYIATSLSVDEIVRSSEEGRTVSVRGYLRFGDDSRNLWSDEDSYDLANHRCLSPGDPAWNHCMTLYEIGRWRSQLLATDRTFVVITGVMHRYPSEEGDISAGACGDLGIAIRSVESA
jgi:hypothetical protein